jgi:phage terminase large subunit
MNQNNVSVFQQIFERYEDDPVGFCTDILGVEPQEWQAELLRAVANPEVRQASCVSGHGTGKSSAASWAMIWHMLTRYPQKTLVTAPTSGQLYDALFAEFKTWIKKLPDALQQQLIVKQDRVELAGAPSESFCAAKLSRPEQPEALAGAHSENILLIADEASGVPEQVFESALGSTSGSNSTFLLLGNGVRSSGFFYDTHHRLKPYWTTFRISCLDSPLVSPAYVEEMRLKYGGEESNAFRVRVLGLFPKSDDDTVIAMEHVELARHRKVYQPRETPIIIAADIARFGDDSTVAVVRQGRRVLEVHSWKKLDLMQTSGRLVELYQRDWYLPVEEILVDSVGLGSGVLDRLRELGLPARGVNVGEAPSMSEKYANLRAELWFELADWFKGEVSIPDNEELVRDLVATRYNYRSNGTLAIESKAETKKRLGHSPDFADALMISMSSRAIDARGQYRRHKVRTKKRMVANVC